MNVARFTLIGSLHLSEFGVARYLLPDGRLFQ